MFAKRRKFILRDGTEVETPLLLPSFSSKTFYDEKVADILQYMAATITDEILISAYDLFYGQIKKKITFPSLIFIDSGGYEASEEIELSDPGKRSHKPRRWTQDFHKRVLRRWDYNIPTVIVSFDSPNAKSSIDRQIARAKTLFKEFPSGNTEILFKTVRGSERFLNIDAIIGRKHRLPEFDIIGVTEKELGGSALERMMNIARLRQALNSINVETPIHVFGSLDTVSSPLYFFAGADIFDGLTWLRYAFDQGNTVYKHNYGARNLGISFEDFRVNAKVWNDNYYYLFHMKEDMSKYLLDHDMKQFSFNVELFERACSQFRERLKEKI